MHVFDGQMIAAIAGVAALGGLIGLDRTAIGQFMISQPIIAAPVTGWVLGDLSSGLIIGVVLELIWLLDMPVGTFVPADSTVSSVCATAIAILGSPEGVPLSVAGFSVLLTVVLAPVTIMSDRVIRQFNSRLGDALGSTAVTDARNKLTRVQLCGLGVFFLKFYLLLIVCIPLGIMAVRMFHALPDLFHRAMTLYIKLLPLLGAAMVVRKLSVKLFDPFLLSGFLVAVLMGIYFQAPAVIVILLAVISGWLGGKYREQRS
jgi:PTS system mannose-specific IIC component